MIIPVIETRNVSKVLGAGAGQVRALKNINLSITGGKLTVLMGPSGSGKTTLLSVLGCMLAPTEGSVFICGHATQGAGPEKLATIRRQHIGFVFQSFHLFPTLTAEENVRLALDVRSEQRRQSTTSRMPHDKNPGRITAVLFDALRDPANRPGGIVGHGGHLYRRGEAVIDQHRDAIMTVLASIAHDHGRAVLVVTHDTRLLEFADRILYVEDGGLTHEERPGANVYRLRA